jgi:hypothetical protein
MPTDYRILFYALEGELGYTVTTEKVIDASSTTEKTIDARTYTEKTIAARTYNEKQISDEGL